MAYGIKFRSVKPASPHLKGNVERSPRTDLEESYPTVDLRDRISRSDCATGRIITISIESMALKAAELRGKFGTHNTVFLRKWKPSMIKSVERLRHSDYRTDLLLRDQKQKGTSNH